MLEWMRAWEHQLLELLEHRAVRLIIYGPPALIFYNVPLGIELLLRHGRQQVTHAICFQPECQSQLVGRHRLEIVRALEPGRPVERSAGTLNHLEMLVRRDMRRALKEHVLKQMRKPG